MRGAARGGAGGRVRVRVRCDRRMLSPIVLLQILVNTVDGRRNGRATKLDRLRDRLN